MRRTLDIATNILTAPRQAFHALADKPSFLVPMLAVILGNCALVLWYYSEVDIVWMTETTLEASAREIPDEVREQQLEAVARMPPAVFGAFAALSSGFGILVVMLLTAGYLSVVSLVTNDGIGYRRWLSLVAWSSLPALISVIASAVNLAMNDITFLPPTEINPLTLPNLLGFEAAGSWFLQASDVMSFWALALMTIGYSTWTGKPLGVALAIVIAPALVIIGIVLLWSAL